MADDSDVSHDIDEILSEIRIVLPGTETLLGFQFAAFFTGKFQHLETAQKVVHLVDLLFIAISTVLLITTPAFHQFREGGRDTRRFLNYSRRLIFAAMASLAIGLAGDIFVASDIVMNNDFWSAVIAIGSLALIVSLWFGHRLFSKRPARE